MHSGSGRTECSGMAHLLFASRCLAQRPLASDLESVTLGSPLDPFVGGSLEDAYCVLISWCTGRMPLASAKSKCNTQVPTACIYGTIPTMGIFGVRPQGSRPDAEGSDLQCRKCAVLRFVVVSWVRFCARVGWNWA